MKDQATYTDTGLLTFEPAGRDSLVAFAEGIRDSGCGISTTLTLREALKVRRALTRAIRSVQAIQTGPEQ